MFDNKAKEYTRKQKIISGDSLVEKAFKDGAIYGYKVGFEACTKSEWHDLRKDPNDLPKGHKVVLNQVGMATQYDPSRGFLGFGGAGIIAWHEVPIFEKE